MAASDRVLGIVKRVRVIGVKTVPRLVSARITFADTGDATVNATDLGASKILGVLGSTVWNNPADYPCFVATSATHADIEALTDAGVDKVVLTLHDPRNADLSGEELTATVLFECE
jgi:hypothetical protein